MAFVVIVSNMSFGGLHRCLCYFPLSLFAIARRPSRLCRPCPAPLRLLPVMLSHHHHYSSCLVFDLGFGHGFLGSPALFVSVLDVDRPPAFVWPIWSDSCSDSGSDSPCVVSFGTISRAFSTHPAGLRCRPPLHTLRLPLQSLGGLFLPVVLAPVPFASLFF